jgi:hypothetical protein
MPLPPGTQLGPYTVLAPLGAGGMGEVYQARDGKLGRHVAIKLLRSDLADQPGLLARFRREARLLAALNHPNIATLYGLEEHDGLRFLVLELVPGQTLAERLAAGPLDLGTALALAGQIAAAVDAAHQAGIIHRDLKPANIKITPGGTVKVLDFGLAKAVGVPDASLESTTGCGSTREGAVLGTPAYMSPEQARGQPLDRRTDVWSFGCVLYEMLAGRRPFAAGTLADTYVAVLEREPDWAALPGATPAAVRDALRRCLRKDPGRRPRDVGDLRLLIEDAAGESQRPPAEPARMAPPPLGRAEATTAVTSAGREGGGGYADLSAHTQAAAFGAHVKVLWRIHRRRPGVEPALGGGMLGLVAGLVTALGLGSITHSDAVAVFSGVLVGVPCAVLVWRRADFLARARRRRRIKEEIDLIMNRWPREVEQGGGRPVLDDPAKLEGILRVLNHGGT